MKSKRILRGLALTAGLGIASLGFNSMAEAANNPFAGVPLNSGYYEDVEALVDNGLIYGYERGEFKTSRQISRMEMAIFTAKAMSAMDSASATDKARIQRLMKEFSSELADMHVQVPGAKKSEEKKSSGPKIKQMPENFSMTGLIRYRYDWGPKETASKGKKTGADGFGGPKNHMSMWQIFTKFNVNKNWTGEIDFIGARDSNGDPRGSGENTEGKFEVNKAFLTGKELGGTFRLGILKGSTVYNNSIIMGQYYQGIDYTRNFGKKFKASATYGKVDYNTATWSGDANAVNSKTSSGNYFYKPNRGVSSTDMNPDGMGVNMTQVQAQYAPDNKWSFQAGWWHLTARGSGYYRSAANTADNKAYSKYEDPNIGEIGVTYKISRKWTVLGRYGMSDWKGTDRFGDQNKAYGLTFKWQGASAANVHSQGLQVDFLHNERYTGIKSTYDLKNKAGEGQRGIMIDYRYIPIKNVMLDLRYMHYKSLGKAAKDVEHGNQYRVQLYYYF